ncbi:MAG: S46 family peptidase [Prevotella sp.]|nr:S46 family peptidase [Prevotella sp.]
MKKLTLLIIGLLAIANMKADEGMWTLYDLDSAVYKQMVAEGFQMPYEDLYYGENSLKEACVNFGGFCSGVVVSPNGLVFTNHHCGFSAINKHSTVEHDYMLNGFFAKSYEEELPNEGLFVSFMKEQKDITTRVNALIKDKTNEETEAIIDSLANLLTDSVKKIDATLHVDIDPFYEGNKYYATTYQDFTDVRLVFAVPKSMGKYGGETDNWMWPRQTCDFSVFRIYADPKTNGPAAYSKDNVPYQPKRWAQVSLQGYKDGDFAMTVGYPGSTSRYLSSYGIEEMRNGENTTRVQVRDKKLAILRKYMEKDEKSRIQYENAFANSSNYWKNSIGMNKCIDSIGLIRQKQEYEARIQRWLKDTPIIDSQYCVDFDLLKGLYAKHFECYRALNYWNESFWRNSEFFTRAIYINTRMEPKGPESNPKKQYLEFEDNSDKWNIELDKELTAAMLKNYSEQVPEEYQPEAVKTAKQKFGGDFDKYVNWLYKKSKLMKKGYKFYFNNKNHIKDPGVALGVDLMAVYSAIGNKVYPLADSISAEEKKLCAAKIRMEQDLPHYSDANFTMRLSYGQVRDVMIGGKPAGYYTTAESIVEKMKHADENAEYYAEPIMHELLSAKDFGKYQDKTTGKMQLCFITNNDITGGNSGSPMFDGKGQLIGLAFDGNWDSLASDILFDKVLARCIGVDIRYVLYLMDKWGHADRLLEEINAQ